MRAWPASRTRAAADTRVQGRYGSRRPRVLSSATQASRTASRSGTGRPSMLPSVRATVLAPGVRHEVEAAPAAERLAEQDVEAVGRVVVDRLAEPARHHEQRLERLDGQRLDRERRDVVGEAPARARHGARTSAVAGGARSASGADGRRAPEPGQGDVERLVQRLHRGGRGGGPAGAVGCRSIARRRRAARSSCSVAPGATPRTTYGSSAATLAEPVGLATPDPVVHERSERLAPQRAVAALRHAERDRRATARRRRGCRAARAARPRRRRASRSSRRRSRGPGPPAAGSGTPGRPTRPPSGLGGR